MKRKYIYRVLSLLVVLLVVFYNTFMLPTCKKLDDIVGIEEHKLYPFRYKDIINKADSYMVYSDPHFFHFQDPYIVYWLVAEMSDSEYINREYKKSLELIHCTQKWKKSYSLEDESIYEDDVINFRYVQMDYMPFTEPPKKAKLPFSLFPDFWVNDKKLFRPVVVTHLKEYRQFTKIIYVVEVGTGKWRLFVRFLNY